MKYTHEIHLCELQDPLDFNNLCLEQAVLKRQPFHCIHWRQFGALCQVYPSGKLICHGSLQVLSDYLGVLRRPIKQVRLSTRSAVHDFERKVDYYKLCQEFPDVSYEPELYHAALLKRGNINFTIYHSGKVCMTGIKSSEDEDNIIMPILLEIELCVLE